MTDDVNPAVVFRHEEAHRLADMNGVSQTSGMLLSCAL